MPMGRVATWLASPIDCGCQAMPWIHTGSDIIPYEPYHPHLGYTLVVTCIAWLGVVLYGRRLLHHPQARTWLYALAIILPLYAELTSYVIEQVRPAPETTVGYELTHIHAHFLHELPIDTELAPGTLVVLASFPLALALFSLARFAYGSLRLRRQLAAARPIDQGAHADVGEHLLQIGTALGGPAPRVLVSDMDAPLAFTAGLRRPAIYVTAPLIDLLTPDELLAVICHEWAHVLRRDVLWNALVRVVRDTLWFLPGGYLAWRRMIVSQDEACDMLAARMTGRPLVLARALVKVAGAGQPSSLVPPLAARFTGGAALQSRVEQMIRMDGAGVLAVRRPASPAGAYLFAGAFLVLAILPALLGS